MSTDPLCRVTGLDVEAFAEQHWSTTPLLRRAEELPGDGFGDLLDLAGVDELVSRRGLRTPFLRMAREGTVLPASRITRSGGAGAGVGDQAADDKILAEFAQGATLVLQALHRTWPPVVGFAAELSRQLGHPVQVNAYVTPSQNTGFSPHYDVHDVFVLQLSGRKHWRIHEPVLEAPLRDQPWDARREEVSRAAEGDPVIDTILEPGDALYLPRGYLHSASALGELSAHLTIGIHPVTRALLATTLMGSVTDDVRLRRSLAAGVDLTDPVHLAADVAATRKALHDAVDRLDDEALAAAVAAHLAESTRPEPLGPLAQLAAAESLAAPDRFVLRPGLRPALEHGDDGTVTLRALGRATTLPVMLADAVTAVLTGAVVTAEDLPLEADDALTLVRRLLREGVVVPAVPR